MNNTHSHTRPTSSWAIVDIKQKPFAKFCMMNQFEMNTVCCSCVESIHSKKDAPNACQLAHSSVLYKRMLLPLQNDQLANNTSAFHLLSAKFQRSVSLFTHSQTHTLNLN